MIDPLVITDTEVRAKVLPLVAGILALVLSIAGAHFLVAGLLDIGTDSAAFRSLGAGGLGLGVVLGAGAAFGSRRGRRRVAAAAAGRTRRLRARVLAADVNTFSRVGTRNPVRLAVEADGVALRRTVYANPGVSLRAGEEIEVLVNPDRPDDFVPLRL